MLKYILGIETSCDETAAAVLEKNNGRIKILSNIVASSANLQSIYGGIIPEQAAREQIKSIIPVIEESIKNSGLRVNEIDAIAVTQGPGLIGSLLVGVETAKTLSVVWNKPLIPVNHLLGHFYANWIDYGGPQQTIPSFPCIGLLVSGGHTDLVLFKNHGKYKYLGGTRDDAAGECFDKCARILGLPYPGGPEISRLARSGNPKSYHLPRPMIDSNDFDFSFSGLKTAVSTMVTHPPAPLSAGPDGGSLMTHHISNMCACIQQAIIDPLVKKTIKAAMSCGVKQVLVAGGVAANNKLMDDLKLESDLTRLKINVLCPPPHLCTDNAAMIASAAFFVGKEVVPEKLQANPNLSLVY